MESWVSCGVKFYVVMDLIYVFVDDTYQYNNLRHDFIILLNFTTYNTKFQ